MKITRGRAYTRVPASRRLAANYTPEPNTGCWLWTKCADRSGYGFMSVGGKAERAYRVAWALVHGDIPGGKVICHRCDQPSCINPDHLFLGDQADNIRDMMAKGRHGARKGTDNWSRGVDRHCAKLNDEDVRTIRALHAEGAGTRALALRYSVDRTNIQLIVRRATWKHVA